MAQWSVGGLFFLWVTTRRREVGIGYGWLLRGVYGLMALLSIIIGVKFHTVPVREVASIGVICAAIAATISSWKRRSAGVLKQREQAYQRSQRVVEMTGIDRAEQAFDDHHPEFDARLDLIAPLIGLVGLIAAGIDAGDPLLTQTLRVVVGAAFLGCVSDAMLLGHWYLTQPGLPRAPLLEMVKVLSWVWPAEVVVMLLPTGMISALTGDISDGWGGMLGWFWLMCAGGTIVLCRVTRAALKERAYSAVMAATGLLYLAIITAFGQDLVARLILSH